MLSNISYYRFFDTHCHLNLDPLNTNIVAILKECQEKKVFVNCVGADFNSSIEAIKIARQYPQQTICSVGIHPEYVDEINKIDELEEHIKTNIEYIFGLGECGLDYHIENYDKQKQINLFKLQIELAIKYKLPLIVHCRDAYEDLYEILKEYNSKLNKILIHCYDTDEHWTEKFNEFGCYYAIGGKISYPKAEYLHAAVKSMPINKIVYETDAPWLSPVPFRKEVNTPVNVIIVNEIVNKILNKNIGDTIFINSVEFFQK